MDELNIRRERRLGANVPTFYDEPVHLVRGDGVWLWDAQGRKYLDCYNNVPHVGHCHPYVVGAIARQAGLLNTHTRYLHETILDYGDRLCATLRHDLSQMIMVCTGSEANDIALRMAEAATGHRGIIATDHTYHGNTSAVAALSRTNPPMTGDGSHVAHIPAPDSSRDKDLSGAKFARDLEAAIDRLRKAGHGFGALIVCPFFANEGFPDLPSGYLASAADVVRREGGVLIADEVQPGFGRLGSHFWGHERMDVAPDIVTMGKPMGNGHPVAAVVTRPDIMERFRRGFRYFNTFGGNPVSAAACMAVLDVIEDEGLQANADKVGAHALKGLHELARRHEAIGAVRGAGLFLGAELVTDRETMAPATDYTLKVVEELRRRGILTNKIGINYNTLKIRPPLVFGSDHADRFLQTLDEVLTDVRP